MSQNPSAISLSETIQGAGLIPVQTEILVANPLLPVLQVNPVTMQPIISKIKGAGSAEEMRPENILDAGAQLPVAPLMPWRSQSNLKPKISILYFWMPGCVRCREDLVTLDKLNRSPKMPDNVQISLIAFDSDLQRPVFDDIKSLGLESPVFIDANSSFAEKLTVLGSPAVYLMDELGNVAARLNGELDFDTPGFDILLARLAKLPRLYENGNAKNLIQILQTDVKPPPRLSVRFLDIPITGWLCMGLILVVCYSAFRTVFHRRTS